MNKKKILIIIISFIFLALILYLFQFFKTSVTETEEAKKIEALVNRAVALVENKGEEAFVEFRKKNSEWFNDKTYVFVYTLDGKVVVYPIKPAFEGRNALDMEYYSNAKNIAQKIIKKAQGEGSGWIDYRWIKPGSPGPVRKISYVKKIEVGEKVFVVGAGIYLN